MTKKMFHCLFLLVFFTVVMPVQAHHSPAAFDPNIKVSVTGVVKEVAWTSPHARLYVDVTLEDGSVENWNFELPSPVGLMRKGWRRSDLVPGG